MSVKNSLTHFTQRYHYYSVSQGHDDELSSYKQTTFRALWTHQLGTRFVDGAVDRTRAWPGVQKVGGT